MGISRKTDYAIRAIRAIYSADEPVVSRRVISLAEDIPVNFLTSILSEMSKAGIVTIYHGKRGGYSLDKDIKDIYLSDIIKIFHGDFLLNDCLTKGYHCNNKDECAVHSEFVRVQKILDTELSRHSLFDIVCTDLHSKTVECERSVDCANF